VSQQRWVLRVVVGTVRQRQSVLAELVGAKPGGVPEDLGGLSALSVNDADGGVVLWASGSVGRRPRTSVGAVVKWARELQLSVPRLRVVVPDLPELYAACGTEAVAELIRELTNYWVEFIVGVDEGGAVFPIRGTAFSFGLLTFAETGREVPFAQIDWGSTARDVALFVAAYRAKIPPQGEELDESAPPAEAPVERADSAQSAQRYINLVLTRNGRLESVVTGPLDVDGLYWLLCNIGERIKESLVGNALENPFPAEHLPPTALGWWLTVVVDGGRDINESDKYTFFLPVDGPSFVCSCTPDGLHHCGDRRLEFLYLGLQTPAEPGLMRLRVMIYLESSLIQALEVSLPVGIQDEVPSGRIVWSRSESFSELELVARRSASAFSEQHDGQHRFVFGMGNGVYAAFELGETQAGSLASSLRTRLYHAHFDTDGGRLVSRYDETLGLDRDRYLADLRTLAVQGAHAYQSLLMDADTRRRLRQWLTVEAATLGRPPIIQLARAVNTRLCFPWQLVYDEPMLGDGSTLAICPSVWEFGPGGDKDGEIPAQCPYREDHGYGDGTLCPFGFWGLAHVLEIPPWNSRAQLPTRTSRHPPASLAVAFHDGLAGPAWDHHLAWLIDLSGTAKVKVSTDTRSLRTAITDGVDVLYFLCHGVRTPGVGSAPPGLALDLGEGGRLTPTDVAAWSRLRPPIRWRSRQPLVILNGCHTGEILPDTVTEFVSAFVADTGAAGILTTEITLELSLAITAMESFLEGLWTGMTTGEALRATRWALLRRGNVMGLSYSPYCDADLSLPIPGGHE
jgi:hypothetical protein